MKNIVEENFFTKKYISVSEPLSTDIIFAFYDQHIFLIEGKTLPTWDQLSHYCNQSTHFYCFGESNTTRYLIAENHSITDDHNLIKIKLRNTFSILDDKFFLLAKSASHLMHWRATHRYCGVCGTKNKDKKDEQALICDNCQHVTYPRISPCIIVLITRGRELLLARSPHFPEKIYSTLAGFVEPGESLEQTLHREIKEEVGLTVTNVTYFGSQPWPFPDSLMIGFHAEYESGDIIIDGIEIEDAQWFDVAYLPQLPPVQSIGRLLIDNYLSKINKS
jgi:NAD+ diphosphatase